MRSSIVATVVAMLALTALPVAAQVPDHVSHLRRGIVGAEAGYGQTPGVSLFFFSSPTTSWLLGMDRVTSEALVGVRGTRTTSLGARAGLRKWARDMTGPFKLFVGAGASVADENTDQTSWLGDGAGYGELGAVWFLSPHLGLTTSGELSFAYGKDLTNGTTFASDDKDRLYVRDTRFRAGAALYLF